MAISFGSGAGYITSSAFTATTTPTSITLPSNVTEGSFIGLLIEQNSASNGINTPSGYTAHFATGIFNLYWKIAGASESNPSVSAITSSKNVVCHLFIVNNVNTSSPINASTTSTAGGGGNWASPTITTTTDNCMLFGGGGISSGTGDWLAGDEPNSMTLAAQLAGTSCWLGFAFEQLGTAGATGTRTPWENQLSSKNTFSFALAPAIELVTIDDTEADTRVTESRTVRITVDSTAPTTGNTSIYINADTNAAITPTSVTTVSGLTVDIAFTVPDEYAGLPYSATGYPIIVDTVDGQASSANVPYLPVTGNDFVNPTVAVPGDIVVLSGTFGTDDQLEYETAGGTISISTSCIITYTGENPAGVSFDIRAWDNADDTWGGYAAMSFGGEGGGITSAGLTSAGITSAGLTRSGLSS